jgi:hypothetical protein
MDGIFSSLLSRQSHSDVKLILLTARVARSSS